MKHIKKFNEENEEDLKFQRLWSPKNVPSSFEYTLINKDELSSKDIISSYVEYHNINKLVLDIWDYAKSNFDRYPTKINNRGMVYFVPGNGGNRKVEFEFEKDGNINIWLVRMNYIGDGKFDNKIIKSSKFSFDKFKEFMS